MKNSINPYNGESLYEFKTLSNSEVKAKIVSGDKAYKSWKATSFDERSNLMLKAAMILQEAKNDYAQIITLEMPRSKNVHGCANTMQKMPRIN